ncbi:MAG: HAD family hydrolase [Oscillospiraceae bacterium]|nr:HAD family hydrolase [Oscillospiraceae bacterium]
MKNIKMIVTDLDRTLLKNDNTVSEYTISILQRCRDKGIKIFIATARPPLLNNMLSWGKNILSLFDGGIYYNGGCVIINKQKEYLLVSDEIVQETINNVCKYEKLNIALQLTNEKHAFRFPLEDKGYKSWGVTSEEALTLQQAVNLRTVKILIFFNNLIDSVTPLDDKLIIFLKELCNENAQFYLTDNGTCVQIMGKSINKATSIEKIRTSLYFKNNEIVVFGDDYNDVEMLRKCGIGVAVENAVDEAKQAADFICATNDNDGVAKWIEENILY